MTRLILFIFCSAFLVGAGASVTWGMALAALGMLGLGGFVACGLLRMLLGAH